MIEKTEQKIKQIRELKNIRCEHIASHLGISSRAYNKIETGETELTIKRLNQISEVLDIHPMELLGFDDKQVFNHCKQTGNIGINYNNTHDKLIQQFEVTIASLQNQIILLNKLLEKK